MGKCLLCMGLLFHFWQVPSRGIAKEPPDLDNNMTDDTVKDKAPGLAAFCSVVWDDDNSIRFQGYHRFAAIISP